MPRKKRSPLFFLPIPDRARLREKFEAPNNLDWLLTFPCWYVRDCLLRAFPPPDPPEVARYLVRRIGETLFRAILQKLRTHHAKDAHQDEAILLRWYPDRAGAFLQQALSHLADRWCEDYADRPRDTLAARCQRLLPSLERLPNLRGKSALPATAKLFFLWVYEEAMRLLERLPPAGQVLTKQVRQRREAIFREAFSNLTASTTKAVLETHPLFHPVSGEFFFEVSGEEYERWLFRSRQEIALEIAVRAVRALPGLTPQYLRRILPDLHAVARRLDEALA